MDGTYTYKQLYGWNSINTNVWLPSMSELVGYNLNNYNAISGVYYAAMQGLNASTKYWTDAQGGAQFLYFQQYNASGGGEAIWNACGREESWIRSPYCGTSPHAWTIIETSIFDSSNNSTATSVYAVHPAVLYNRKKAKEKGGKRLPFMMLYALVV